MPVYVIQVQLFNDDGKYENLFKCGYTANIGARVKGVVKELSAAGYKEARAGLWLCLLDGDMSDESSLLYRGSKYPAISSVLCNATVFPIYERSFRYTQSDACSGALSE